MGAATSTLLTVLTKAGVNTNDAQVLDAHFAAEPAFMEGLETVAEVLAHKSQLTGPTPPGDPWRSIYSAMATELAGGADHDTAWINAISPYPPDVQFALTAAIRAGIDTVLAMDQQKGKNKIKTAHYLRELKTLGYEFRQNLCDDGIEVIHADGRVERLTDGLFAHIYRQMADKGYRGQEEVSSCISASAYLRRYHPVRDYLDSLSYDGGDYISELATYLTDAHGVMHLWLRKWLIGVVAKTYTGAQNPMLVLDGPQNIGKSSFARWLASPLPNHFVESPINPENKDHLVMLISKWIWEVMELGGTMRKADQEALKGFLTLQEVNVRAPYARYPIQKPALASFIGTVNNAGGILNDPTGSRRFLIVKLTHIDWNYSQLDINRVWSEAVAAYHAGEPWTLAPDEIKRRDEINEEYQIDDVIEGLLKELFTIDSSQTGWWMATTDILRVLEDPAQGNLKGGSSMSNSIKLGQTMAKLGLKRKKARNINGQLVNGYIGIKRSP